MTDVANRRIAKTELLHVNAGHDFGALREPAMLAHVVACTAKFLLDSKDEMPSEQTETNSE
ncbi:hypothetical protein [Actibacterium sp. 188UL27-1]|uniref:hypothetical protein n=1 Tax=Actibacterium sp. 188UL27-1 TaxID=2786961 RepID=UPI00195899B2|nr:hypothetical protein [Actibacterium sp. 188UL27-1]MBM7067011.1 hypothetical protein [Actibacterium sp. 188UL27-1]